MTESTGALTKKVASGSPYQLDNDQVTRATKALLKHIKSESKSKATQSGKKSLLAEGDSDSEDELENETPIWLIMTTKQHIVDKNRLKPGKIPVPHSLNTSESLRICLLTADPQRAVKDVIADPSFPTSLSSRITTIIGFSKLKAKYHTFESRRQLLAEHDVFLADDRIINRLVDALGKIFYKSSKRPIPISIGEIQRKDGKRLKRDERKRPPTDEKYAVVASPAVVAKEIEKTLGTVPVQLAPATTTAVRVGRVKFTPEQIAENVTAVVQGLTDRFVTKGWRNVKAIHLKGPNTMALPVWLASELWVDGSAVTEQKMVTEKEKKKPAKKEIADKKSS
ncbi:Ribosomal protein L1 [Ascosphaera apis ARSEF 7405]|uniref:Ribosomal protein L1 n=1 Tax=Ascosphaera apis ARSEF 7405 TaxID=392613 RepID=A0A167UT69_9EURO|nr:Ribosomal protein L1 [Ascosphaera apis ARSEF 7405]